MKNLVSYILSVSALSAESRLALLECGQEIFFRKNDVLLQEGQICNAIFFISSGLCRTCFNRDGREINTDFHFENDFATNISSLTSGKASAYAIKACEKTTVVKLDKSKLLHAYQEFHQVESFGRSLLAGIAAKQEAHAASFKLLTPKERYERLPEIHPDFLQRVSLSQIASYLGISRETLSRYRAMR